MNKIYFPELEPAKRNVPIFGLCDFEGSMDDMTCSELSAIGALDSYPYIAVFDNQSGKMLVESNRYPNTILAYMDAKRIVKNYANAHCVVYGRDFATEFTVVNGSVERYCR